MSIFKSVWGLLFRLFPCPTNVGLRKVGRPNGNSPVLVTCNFELSVKRLTLVLERSSTDAWLLVAQSKGVNVWCAAGGDEFNTRSVVSAVKTSGIGDLVGHRTLMLPPLGAPGICARDVEDQTGWKTRWGPVRAEEIPACLSAGGRRNESMKRVTYNWQERLDTALGSLFTIYMLGALGFLLLGRGLLVSYLVAGSAAFLTFFLLCPWIPGTRGLIKVVVLETLLACGLVAGWLVWRPELFPLRAELIIAMVMILLYGTELGGLASTMPSELDPLLARLGIGAVGNVALAGTVRTELLNGYRELTYDSDTCIGCGCCSEVCPQGVWELGEDRRAVPAHLQACTACRACLVQCPSGSIQANPTTIER